MIFDWAFSHASLLTFLGHYVSDRAFSFTISLCGLFIFLECVNVALYLFDSYGIYSLLIYLIMLFAA